MVPTVNVNVQTAFAPPAHGWAYATTTLDPRQTSDRALEHGCVLKTHDGATLS